jgi:hypothetical protein
VILRTDGMNAPRSPVAKKGSLAVRGRVFMKDMICSTAVAMRDGWTPSKRCLKRQPRCRRAESLDMTEKYRGGEGFARRVIGKLRHLRSTVRSQRSQSCGARWTAADIPDQGGRVAIVTGANSGLGYATAKALADHGAHVVLAVRDLDKGRAAARSMSQDNHRVDCTVQRVDLADLGSVRAAADELKAHYPRIDLLINNAGVCWTPYMTTADGFELQFGTNHLGHFALTGLLLEHMLAVP